MINQSIQQTANPLKLYLGCGRKIKPGYINVDQYLAGPNITQMDIFNLPFPPSSVDEIFTEHMLEHLSKYEVPQVLKEWARVLKPEGQLVMNLPNLEWCLRQWLDKPESERWGWQLDTIFGLQSHPGEFHKTGFTAPRLRQLLAKAGFRDISIADCWSHGQSCFWVEASKAHKNTNPLDKVAYSTSIVVPWWDHGELLEIWGRNLKHLSDIEIIFIDNGSQPPTRDALKRFCQTHNIKLIRNSENRGFAAANNQGIQVASNEYILFLNNDIEVLTTPVPYLCQLAGEGLAGPGPKQTETGEVYLEGWALCVKKQVLESFGGWCEDYGPGYWDDVDFCHRAKSSGYSLTPIPEDIKHQLFTHNQNTTGRDGRLNQLKLHVRNRGIFIQKYYLNKMPKIVIDGMFFQFSNTGIARVWSTLLAEWSRSNFADHLLVLDRNGSAPRVPGIRYRLIPPYSYSNAALDRAILQQICDEEQASLFISTYYTTPISTPSVFMAYDMIPEQIGWDVDEFMWRVKHYAIQHADRYIAISQNTARDLAKLFPYIAPEAIAVAPCGVQPSFVPAGDAEVNEFKQKHQITQPYFLMVGTRNGYKNTILFCKAFAKLANAANFSIVCTGGNSTLEPDLSACLPAGTRVHLLQLNDAELRMAYAGAIALVYPSQYEGFGLPILEAMACGCPVITCPNGSIPEVAGQAALYVKASDVAGLTAALQNVQNPTLRDPLIKAGLEQAKQFSWLQMAKTVSETLMAAAQQAPPSTPYSAPMTIAAVDNRRLIALDSSSDTSSGISPIASPISQAALPPQPVALSLPTPPANLETYEQYQQMGRSLIAEHQLEDAIQALEKAHQLSPRDPVALQDLGTAYKAKADESRMQADFYLGFALYRQGKYQAAIERYQKFLRSEKTGVAPELIQRVYKCLGDCFQRLGQYDAAIQLYREAVQAYPTATKLYFDLISALRDDGQTEAAIAAATDALSLLPNDLSLKLAQQLTLPILYATTEEIAVSRQRFSQGLARIGAELDLSTPEASKNALEGISRYANFYLAYQGENDRALQQQYGLLVHQIMATNYPQWVQDRPMPPLSPSGKIRIGYLSDCLRLHTVGKLFLGWLRHCDREKFEIHCYSLNREQDAITQGIQRYSDAFHQISGDLTGMCQQILNDELHVLTFLDIGMHPKASQIASLRLAPVQCLTWGHPVTSGLPTVDYFLSSDLMEPENGEEHYSEQLVRLPQIGIAYAKPTIPELIKTRADFGLRPDAVVYLSCQSLFKYLPQYDFVFAAIAQQVPDAQFAFLAHFSAAVTEKFRQRLQRAFAAVGLNSEDYCVILPRQNQAGYLQLNLLSDIFLDTFDWSGGNTTLEAIACNLPVVTCPGEFMRGRHAAGILQALSIPEAIAATPEEYVAIAVKLGLDSAWRQEIEQRITQGHAQLFDDSSCVKALESFYQQVAQGSSSKL
ncbi:MULTISPECIES: glycosyltransferase [Trichocoleus]|uniref:protein O-GlcNAc transferase n=1 Tax=Trichocoleus desertorum GB2-A4 TaxID=2933944 RepID=A0ABV0J385_9CYAN|nr:glycosyltransferase [Trichocoleus sp. FACHB-46]